MQREQRRIALLCQGGKVLAVEKFGYIDSVSEGSDDEFDLLMLNFHVLLDALRRENVSLHYRILANWRMFQHLRRSFNTDAPTSG